MSKHGATTVDVRVFLKVFEEYKLEIEFSNEDGVERQAANLRELVASYRQQMIKHRQFGGREMNDEMLHAGLRKFACIKEGFDRKKFAAEMPRLLKMDPRLPFDDRFTKVQSRLFEYLSDNGLHGQVMPEGRWDTGAGSVVLKAVLRVLEPTTYRRGVQTLAEMERGADLGGDGRSPASNPNDLFRLMESEGERQRKVEGHLQETAEAVGSLRDKAPRETAAPKASQD